MRADQADLVVWDIARSSVIPTHRYKLDAKTRAAVAISAKTSLKARQDEARCEEAAAQETSSPRVKEQTTC